MADNGLVPLPQDGFNIIRTVESGEPGQNSWTTEKCQPVSPDPCPYAKTRYGIFTPHSVRCIEDARRRMAIQLEEEQRKRLELEKEKSFIRRRDVTYMELPFYKVNPNGSVYLWVTRPNDQQFPMAFDIPSAEDPTGAEIRQLLSQGHPFRCGVFLANNNSGGVIVKVLPVHEHRAGVMGV